MIKLTKSEALTIQAAQIDHYAGIHGERVRAIVRDATTAYALSDGVEYDVVVINRHIPRGEWIEHLIGARITA